jgi:hypothetical protein
MMPIMLTLPESGNGSFPQPLFLFGIFLMTLPPRHVIPSKWKIILIPWMAIYWLLFWLQILAADPDINGIATEFACPVEVSVYLAVESNLSPDKLKRIVEERDVKARSADDRA